MHTWKLEADRVALGVTEEGGHLDAVRFRTERGVVAPMHVAPWAGENLPADVPPILRILRGDFFCAPFGDSDLLPEETRVHGSPANAPWRRLAGDDHRLELELTVPILGARLVKRVCLRPGHAMVYQEHDFEGGTGRIPAGHHAMLRAPEPLALGFSRWVWGGTPPAALEPDPRRGRSLLAYPQTFDDLARVRLADGRTADLRQFPALAGHDDLLMLIADPARPLAWSAATAPRRGWVWFALKSPRSLRGTVLWLSHGGRQYPPWSGRHTHTLGIEEVTALFNLGHRASIADNPLSRQGHPTAIELRPARRVRIRYAFGLVAAPPGFGRVQSLDPEPGGVTLTDEHGTRITAPCDPGFVMADDAP